MAGGDLRAPAPDIRLADVGVLLREHLPADDPLACYADRLTGDALGNQSLRGYLSGSVDAVLRIGGALPGGRLQDELAGRGRPATDVGGLRAGRGWPRRCCTPTIRCRRCCTALCCTAFCGGGSLATSRERHLGGVLYLFVRGMCGADTPVVDGHPAGVFSWQPPASLVVAVSDLLDAGRAAA